MISSTGRTTRSTLSERDIQMPSGMPMLTASSVAVSMSAIVFMPGSHNPKKPSRNIMALRPAAVFQLRVAAKPMIAMMKSIAYQGSQSRKFSIAISRWTTGRKISSSAAPQCSTIQLKELSIEMRTFRISTKSGNCSAISSPLP